MFISFSDLFLSLIIPTYLGRTRSGFDGGEEEVTWSKVAGRRMQRGLFYIGGTPA